MALPPPRRRRRRRQMSRHLKSSAARWHSGAKKHFICGQTQIEQYTLVHVLHYTIVTRYHCHAEKILAKLTCMIDILAK